MGSAATRTSLKGHTVFLTGSSRGLGREIARHMAAAGANLALVARDAGSLQQMLQELDAEFTNDAARRRIYPADLTDDGQIDAVVANVLRDFGAIDVVVNNAGIQGPIGPLDRVDWPAWRHVIQVNLLAPVRICQLVIPHMRERRHGRIINLSGGGATGPRPDFSAYAAAKCALVRLTETLAEEVAEYGITINSVAPGAMNTRMLDELLAAGPEGAPKEYARAVKQSETGGTPPALAAELVVWLASSAADGITGRLLSARWDPWASLPERREELMKSDIYTLRRIVPEDRGKKW